MIDLHCHALPGVDDGPRELDGSLALAAAALAAGTETVVATPHVSYEYPANDHARIAAAVQRLNAALGERGVTLRVLAGAEVSISRAAELEDEELAALRLGGGPWLLVESPLTPATGFEAVLERLHGRGHRIVLAHPERCPGFQRHPEALAALVHSGMLTSLTAGAFTGRFGRRVQRFAAELWDEGLVHNVASDAHDARRRPPVIAAELERAGLTSAAGWLAGEVPAAILAGGPIPPPPSAQPPRRPGLGRLWPRPASSRR